MTHIPKTSKLNSNALFSGYILLLLVVLVLSLPFLFLVPLLQHEATHLSTRLYVGQEVFNSL